MPIPFTQSEAELELFYAYDGSSLRQMRRQSTALSTQLEHFGGEVDGAPEYGDAMLSRGGRGGRGAERLAVRKLLRPSPSGWFTPQQQLAGSSEPQHAARNASFAYHRQLSAPQAQMGRSAPQLLPRRVSATAPPPSCVAASGMANFGVLSNLAIEMAYQLAHAYQVPVELPVSLRPPSQDNAQFGGSAASSHADGQHDERMPARPQSAAQWRGFQQQEMERWLARQGVPEWHIAHAVSPGRCRNSM